MTVIQKARGHHALCLTWLKECQPANGHPFVAAEVGVASGANAMRMLAAFPALRLLMVDPWSGDEEYRQSLPIRGPWEETLRTVDGLHREQQEWYEAAVRDTEFASDRRVVVRMSSVQGASLIADGVLSFCFIDGDHRYDSVKNDLAAWWPKVRRGGIFAGHDYARYMKHEVVKAVNEWRDETGLNVQGLGRSWWVRKD